jgi:CheY-like chemotaxis protein
LNNLGELSPDAVRIDGARRQGMPGFMDDTSRYVLVVEDNLDDERLTLRALKELDSGLGAKVARDGAEAIDLLANWPCDEPHQCPLPTLILLDLNLPKVSGHMVLQAYRAHWPTQDVPIVIVSSTSDQSDIRKVWEMGANDYLKKPMDFFEYITVISSVARMWLPKALVA